MSKTHYYDIDWEISENGQVIKNTTEITDKDISEAAYKVGVEIIKLASRGAVVNCVMRAPQSY